MDCLVDVCDWLANTCWHDPWVLWLCLDQRSLIQGRLHKVHSFSCMRTEDDWMPSMPHPEWDVHYVLLSPLAFPLLLQLLLPGTAFFPSSSSCAAFNSGRVGKQALTFVELQFWFFDWFAIWVEASTKAHLIIVQWVLAAFTDASCSWKALDNVWACWWREQISLINSSWVFAMSSTIETDQYR